MNCAMAVLLSSCFLFSCGERTTALSPEQFNEVKDSVSQMMASVSADLSHKGPVAWLNYFENTKEFFMASDGRLVFPGIDSARLFINHTLVKGIEKMILQWQGLRVEPLSSELATIAAGFQEEVIAREGKKTIYAGYFTGLARRSPQGWKLHSLHWSILKP